MFCRLLEFSEAFLFVRRCPPPLVQEEVTDVVVDVDPTNKKNYRNLWKARAHRKKRTRHHRHVALSHGFIGCFWQHWPDWPAGKKGPAGRLRSDVGGLKWSPSAGMHWILDKTDEKRLGRPRHLTDERHEAEAW